MSKKKIPTIFTLGASLILVLILMTINYYDKDFVDLTTSDFLFFSMWGAILGFAIGVISLLALKRTSDFNISGTLLLIFAIILWMCAGDITLLELPMRSFLTACTFFLIPLVLGVLLITRINKTS